MGLGPDSRALADRLRRLSDLLNNPEYKEIPSFIKNEIRATALIAQTNQRHVEDISILLGDE